MDLQPSLALPCPSYVHLLITTAADRSNNKRNRKEQDPLEKNIYTSLLVEEKEKAQQEDGSCVSPNKKLSYVYITAPKSTLRFCLFIYLSVCLCLPPPPSPPRPHKVASRSPGHRNSSESH
jgi:hypothetical protein